MSEPILEQINAWLVSAIEDITTANGYHQDLAVVRPGDLEEAEAPVEDLTTIVGLEDPEPLGPRTRAGLRWRQPFGIITFFVGQGGTAVSIDKRINRVRSDIEKRIGVELTAASEAGGRIPPASLCNNLADDIDLLAPEIFIDTENKASVLLCRVAISYRVSATTPYSQT